MAKKFCEIGQKILALPKRMHLKERAFALFLFFIVVMAGGVFAWDNLWGNFKEVPIVYGGFVEGVVGQPQILNPMFPQTDADRDLSKLIFSQLIFRNNEGKWQGDLAEKYSISDDQKTLNVQLRKNLLWQDGEKLDADDVVFSYNAVKRPDYAGLYARTFQNVKIEKKDDLNLRIVSDKPMPDFLSLAELPIIPKHKFAEDSLPFSSEFSARPVGSGPFQYSQASQAEDGRIVSIELVSNKKYYRGEPYFSRFSIRFFESEEKLFQAAMRGEISGMLSAKLGADRLGLKLNEIPEPAYIAAFLNLGSKLKNKELREALSLAIDRKKMQEELGKDFGEAIGGPIFAEAYQEIAQADFSLAQKKMLDSKLGKINLKLLTPDESRFEDLARFLKSSWDQLGIEIEVKTASREKLEQVIIPEHDFDILLFGQKFGTGTDVFSFWHSSQIASGGNVSSWQNKEADAVLAKSRETISGDERDKLYNQVAQLILKDQPALFLFQPNFVYGLKAEIKGVTIRAMQTAADRFAEVEKWYIKTKRVRVK